MRSFIKCTAFVLFLLSSFSTDIFAQTSPESLNEKREKRKNMTIREYNTDAQGRKLKVWLIPQPGPLFCSEEEAQGVVDGSGVPRDSGHRLAGSYVNFLITNDRIVYPLLDAATDGEAQRILEEIFPEHKVVGVPAREILLGGGNIHCITQQIPSGK